MLVPCISAVGFRGYSTYGKLLYIHTEGNVLR